MMTAQRADPRLRRGFTLIELAVVTGILSILAALLLPTVQEAREAARRARCAHHLRQLIQATHQFETVHGGFPSFGWSGLFPKPPVTANVKPVAGNFTSVQCALLPYLEQVATFHAINFHIGVARAEDIEASGYATVAHQTIEVFLCPTDPKARGVGSGPAPISYRANFGSGTFRLIGPMTYLAIEDGAFVGTQEVLRLGSFRDGLANTLAFAEKPIGSGPFGSYHAFRDWVQVASLPLPSDEWATVCSQRHAADPKQTNAGSTWMLKEHIYTIFYVKQPPNDSVPDCGDYGASGTGIFTSRSYHPGGVNAALCDGSVRFFSDRTNIKTWRALGTRAGSD
jgi:prepilin-type N-terminal cleavage/methylation domain-containing protein/prepilin-type processing-associated H-X9-DG protein